MMTTTIIIDMNEKSGYGDILRTILRSDMEKTRYEIIFLGQSLKGFNHAVISKAPLVRTFYDNILSSAQKVNGAVAESHCDMILLWPGLSFLKNNFKPIPEDVKDPIYYLMLWLRLSGCAEDWPWWFDFKGCKPENGFGPVIYKCNLPDTLRLWHMIGGNSWRVQVWYYGFLIKAIGRRLGGK